MRKDVLFRGCTRPAMFMGVPYLPFFLGAGGALLFAMWFGLQYLLLIPVVIVVMRQMARRDELIFRLLFLRLKFNAGAAGCSKADFCAAVAAEGISIRPRYVNPASMNTWFVKRRVFGSSGLPWSAPEYRGDRHREFPCPNAMAALALFPVVEGGRSEQSAPLQRQYPQMNQAVSPQRR